MTIIHRSRHPSVSLLLTLIVLFSPFTFFVTLTEARQHSSNNNQVIILSTSKFWHNFRQATNALLIYDILKKQGIKDSNILLMIPENAACNARNNNPGIVCHIDQETTPNLFRNAEIDYKLHDITQQSVLNIFKGRYDPYTPRSKRLIMNKNTKLLSYFTGHGGDGYIKIQDTTVIMDDEMRDAMNESHSKSIYNEVLMFSDSCGAATVFEKLQSPNIYSVGSSSRGEKSLSYGMDSNLGLSVVDRFTRINYMFLSQNLETNKRLSLADITKEWPESTLEGHYSSTNTFPKKTEKNIYFKDFFKNQSPRVNDVVSLSKDGTSFRQLQGILDEISLIPQDNFKISNKVYF